MNNRYYDRNNYEEFYNEWTSCEDRSRRNHSDNCHHNKSDNCCRNRNDDNCRNRSDNCFRNRNDDNCRNRSDNCFRNRNDDNCRNRSDNCCKNRSDDNCRNRSDDNCRNRGSNRNENRSDNCNSDRFNEDFNRLNSWWNNRNTNNCSDRINFTSDCEKTTIRRCDEEAINREIDRLFKFILTELCDVEQDVDKISKAFVKLAKLLVEDTCLECDEKELICTVAKDLKALQTLIDKTIRDTKCLKKEVKCC